MRNFVYEERNILKIVEAEMPEYKIDAITKVEILQNIQEYK